MKKILGGESLLLKNSLFTDSGRSSLKLILDKLPRDFQIMLPDFICPVIIDVIEQKGFKYSFYHVNQNFEPEIQSEISAKTIVYLLDFFNIRQSLSLSSLLQSTLVIHDQVFSPMVENYLQLSQWFGFNSFRKCSPLADGSSLQSSENWDFTKDIRPQEAKFAKLKYHGKELKKKFLAGEAIKEADYLSVLQKAEARLDRQTKIYSISKTSLLGFYALFSQDNQAKRSENFKILDKQLNKDKLPACNEFSSHYLLLLEDRDILLKTLKNYQIYLPGFWPRNPKADNLFYSKLMAISIDPLAYTQSDLRQIAEVIKKEIKE